MTGAYRAADRGDICAGLNGSFADGRPRVNGIAIGFMGVISRAATVGDNSVEGNRNRPEVC
jgi:hypothetical protein